MKTAAFISLCLLAAMLASGHPTVVIVTEETAFTFYRPFKRLTKEPHLVSPLIATLCISPRPDLIEREKRATGPHFNARVHIYANPLADDTIARKLEVFPAGAVIVKEKLTGDGSVSGVGGMLKRAPGFDAKNGDWEYFYADKVAGFSIGQLKNCAACHANTKATDYVFGVWNR